LVFHHSKDIIDLEHCGDIIMHNSSSTFMSILKVIALAMAVASIIMGIFRNTSLETHVTLLVIGMFAMAMVVLLQGPESV
jgi:hypothetical protein